MISSLGEELLLFLSSSCIDTIERSQLMDYKNAGYEMKSKLFKKKEVKTVQNPIFLINILSHFPL